MPSKSLDVTLEPPMTGWMTIRLRADTQEFDDSFSHIYPSLEQLCSALCEVAQGFSARAAVFLLEPSELELRFVAESAGRVQLSVLVFPDNLRGLAVKPRVWFVHVGDRRDVVLRFWRALRRLESSIAREAFLQEWGRPFPALEMAALTKIVRSWKRGEAGRGMG